MSHDIESPVPPVGQTRGEGDGGLPLQRSIPAPPDPTKPPASHGHVMSSGAPHLARPGTMSGIGSSPEVPAPPLTEVIPAPPFLRDPESALGRALAEGPNDDSTAEPLEIARPRPSETLMGARAPLHTATDANTQVDVATLTPGDAERIIAAAEAERRAPRKAPPTGLPAASRTSSLPPPPGIRRSAFPPRAGGVVDPFPKAVSGLGRPPATTAAPPSSVRSSYPPPPPKRASTLLLGGEPSIDAPKSVRSTPSRPAPTPPPRSVRTPPLRPPPRARPEELSDALLLDDTGERKPFAGPPQPISSTSLVEDPPSSPDLDLEEEVAPLAAHPATTHGGVPLGDPRADPPLAAAAKAEEARPAAPQPELLELMALAEPIRPNAGVSDPFPPQRLELEPTFAERPTAPMAAPLLPPPERISIAPVRPPWMLPAAMIGAAVTLAISVGLLAFAIKWVHSAIVGAPTAAATSSAEPSSPAPAVSASVGLAAPPAAGSSAPCVLAGAPHTIAPKALLRTGIESTASADRIAIGVGLAEREGFVVALDPSSFVVSGSSRAHADAPLRRVLPILVAASDLNQLLETTRRGKGLVAGYPVNVDPPFIVGVEDATVVWAASTTAATTQLWPIAGTAPVEAMRAIVLPNHAGFVVAFRQGTSIYLGALNDDKTVHGDLSRIGGLGPQIGAPAIATNGDHVLVAWADRATQATPWAIRWLTWRPGTEPAPPTPFPVPAGGSGGATMSPGLTSLSGGRFVMAWTEGTAKTHQVRAQELDATEHFVGNALTVSAEGVNAGQGVPVLTPDGRGAVAFLATPTGATASVVAVPIVCPSSP